MPPVVAGATALLVGIAGGVEAIGVAGVVWASAIAEVLVGVGTSALLSFAQSALLGPSSSKGSAVTGPVKLNFTQDSQEMRTWAYGRVSAGGTLKYWVTTGQDNKYLWMVVVYHDTPIDAVEAFYVNQMLVNFTSNDATTAPFAGFMSRYDFLGAVDQAAESNLHAADPTHWTDNHRLRGIAGYVWKLTYDQTVYSTGRPEPLIVYRARKVWDFRKDTAYGGVGTHDRDDETTWEWSANSAICTADYVLGVKLDEVFIGGMKCPIDGIDIDSFVSAANICDEDVALKAGGTEKRYTLHGIVGSLEDKQSVFASMLQTMAAVPVVNNGKLGIVPGAAIAATVTLTDDDLCGPIQINPSRSFQDKHNTITSVYYDRLAKSGTADLAAVSDPDFVDADGGVTLEREIRHRFTDSGPTAQRLNKIFLADEREQLSIEATWKPKAAQIPLYGTFLWTSAIAGYTSQKMRILNRQRQPDGSFHIIARQETDSKYDWAESIDELDPPSFATHAGFDPTDIDPPPSGDITIAATSLDGVGGSSMPIVKVKVAAPANPFVTLIMVEWQQDGDSVWNAAPPITPNFGGDNYSTITGLASSNYNIRVAYRTNFGTSSWTQKGPYGATGNLPGTGGTTQDTGQYTIDGTDQSNGYVDINTGHAGATDYQLGSVQSGGLGGDFITIDGSTSMVGGIIHIGGGSWGPSAGDLITWLVYY